MLTPCESDLGTEVACRKSNFAVILDKKSEACVNRLAFNTLPSREVVVLTDDIIGLWGQAFRSE
jgi:hypothetical protein